MSPGNEWHTCGGPCMKPGLDRRIDRLMVSLQKLVAWDEGKECDSAEPEYGSICLHDYGTTERDELCEWHGDYETARSALKVAR